METITVRPIEDRDTDLIVAWRNNPRVRDNFIYREIFTPEGHRHWMETKVKSGEVCQFILEWEGRPVGSVYLRDIDRETGQAEYGVFLGEDDSVGKGIGNFACKWAVAFAKEELGLSHLILRVFADNEAAVRSYQNAGFREREILPDYLDGRDLLMMERSL